MLLSVPPESSQELYTGHIAEEVALLSKAHAIISRQPKGNPDATLPNQADAEFEASVKKFLEDIRVGCILAIFGKNDPSIEIRTSPTGPQTDEFVHIIKEGFVGVIDLKISNGEKGQPADSPIKVTTIGLGLGPDERGFQKNAVVSRLANIVGLINSQLGGSEGDKRAGDALD